MRESEDISFDTVKKAAPQKAEATPTAGERKVLYYRNPMGLPDTSKVPKKDSMGMDYLPVYEGEEADSSVVKVSLGKLQRTGVKTATAENAVVNRQVRVPGTVTFDERLVRIVSMRANAFIEGVADVTTGDRVLKGDELFHFFSKDIAKAGAEYTTELRGGGKPDLDVGVRCNCAISACRKRPSKRLPGAGRCPGASLISPQAMASSSNGARQRA